MRNDFVRDNPQAEESNSPDFFAHLICTQKSNYSVFDRGWAVGFMLIPILSLWIFENEMSKKRRCMMYICHQYTYMSKSFGDVIEVRILAESLLVRNSTQEYHEPLQLLPQPPSRQFAHCFIFLVWKLGMSASWMLPYLPCLVWMIRA